MISGFSNNSIERSSAKWKCASPQAQTDINYTTPPAGEQERLERLEKKVGWFDPPKKLRRTVQKRSDDYQEEVINQVSRKLNFNEDQSPQLSSYSLSPNTLTSPFSRLKLSPEQNTITRNNINNNYNQFSPSEQATTMIQQGYNGIINQQQQQQQQQYVPLPLQAQYGQQQIQQRGNFYYQQQGEQQYQQQTQQLRQNPISRQQFVIQTTTNSYRTNSNNNNNILKFR